MPTDDATLLATAERRRQVLQLRETGATWRAIARTLEQAYGPDKLPSGWDARYAYKDFQRTLDKLHDEAAESAQQVREMEARRLDRLQRGIWDRAIGGDKVTWRQQKEALDRVLKIQQRRARLLGLDAPEKVDLGGDVKVSVIDFSPPKNTDEG